MLSKKILLFPITLSVIFSIFVTLDITKILASEKSVKAEKTPPEDVKQKLKKIKKGHAIVKKTDGTIFEISDLKIRETVIERGVKGALPRIINYIPIRFKKKEFWFSRSVQLKDIQSIVFIDAYRGKAHIFLKNGEKVLIEPKYGGPHRLAFVSADGTIKEEHIAERLSVQSYEPLTSSDQFKNAHYGNVKFVGTAHVEGEKAEWDGPMWIFASDHIDRIDFKTALNSFGIKK